jgi:hypothetical protein
MFRRVLFCAFLRFSPRFCELSFLFRNLSQMFACDFAIALP